MGSRSLFQRAHAKLNAEYDDNSNVKRPRLPSPQKPNYQITEEIEALLESKGTSCPPIEVAEMPQKRGGLRTFEDVATAGHRRPALKELPSNADWLPPVLPRMPHVDSTNIISNIGTYTDTTQLGPLPEMPMDWSLKSIVRITTTSADSDVSDTLKKAMHASGRDATVAHRAIVSGMGIDGLLPHQSLLASLISFQYPATGGSGGGGGGSAGGSSGGGNASSRRNGTSTADYFSSSSSSLRSDMWRTALCSAYDALRNGFCDVFYVLSPEGSRRPMAAMFCAQGINNTGYGDNHRLHAVLSRSTAGLRALIKSKLGLNFDMPLVVAPVQHQQKKQQQPQQQQNIDEGNKSLLWFKGGQRMHGLFELLLNEGLKTLHTDGCDVPTILAPVPFMNAAVSMPTMKTIPTVASSFRAEIRGVLAPWVCDRMLSVLASSSRRSNSGSFTLVFDTDPVTANFNAKFSRKKSSSDDDGGDTEKGITSTTTISIQISDYKARQRGCLNEDEAKKWRSPSVPSGGTVREVKYEGGVFTGRCRDM